VAQRDAPGRDVWTAPVGGGREAPTLRRYHVISSGTAQDPTQSETDIRAEYALQDATDCGYGVCGRHAEYDTMSRVGLPTI
jgi:hypothetical protein